MKGKLNSNLGDVYIDNAVIAKCAGTIAIECFGIVGMGESHKEILLYFAKIMKYTK